MSAAGVAGPLAPLAPLALRLRPGEDLKLALTATCAERAIDAAIVLGCVGSLQCVALRYAGRDEIARIAAKFEIIALSGTLSRHGVHLHVAVADEDGRVLAGHLMEGSLVFTTVELVLGIVAGVIFTREHDDATGFRELRIRNAGDSA